MVGISKSRLAIVLSELKDFENHDLMLEQYSTPSEIAAEMLWNAYMKGDVDGKVIVDAACGPGFIGVGALILGAKQVIFVDKSESALKILRENLKFIDDKYEFGVKRRSKIRMEDIAFLDEKADVVMQNPPFGTKEKHIDKLFLEKAFSTAEVIYSFHKSVTKFFVRSVASNHGFKVMEQWRYDFVLKATQKFHQKSRKIIDVTVFRIVKQ